MIITERNTHTHTHTHTHTQQVLRMRSVVYMPLEKVAHSTHTPARAHTLHTHTPHTHAHTQHTHTRTHTRTHTSHTRTHTFPRTHTLPHTHRHIQTARTTHFHTECTHTTPQVFNEGDLGRELFYLLQGAIELLKDLQPTGIKLKDGAFFGEVCARVIVIIVVNIGSNNSSTQTYKQ